jgi:hypothetical protein
VGAGSRRVEHYNDIRLNSAVGYITSKDMLVGRQKEIHAGRDQKLEEARNSGGFVDSKLVNKEKPSLRAAQNGG